MNLIAIIIVLVIIGVLLWAIETIIPMDATIKIVIRVLVLLVVLLWLLSFFMPLGAIHLGR